jgi:hypothetical protein
LRIEAAFADSASEEQLVIVDWYDSIEPKEKLLCHSPLEASQHDECVTNPGGSRLNGVDITIA